MEAIRALLGKKQGLKARLRLVQQGEKRLNHIDKEGNSIAHLAVIEDKLELLEELKPKALRLDARNEEGLKPVDLALYLDRTSIAQFLGYKKRETLQIFRNKDQKLHHIPICELEQKLGFKFTDHLHFASYKDFLVSRKRAQRILRSDTYKKMNEWVLSMHGKSLQRSPDLENIYLRHISKQIGYGVFAAKRIPALSFVGEYTGQVQRRPLWKKELGDYVFAYHAAQKSTRFIVNGEAQGNFTRFINHSEKANLLSRWVVDKGLGRIIFFTKRVIEPHEQLTYDYGDFFWRKRETPLPL